MSDLLTILSEEGTKLVEKAAVGAKHAEGEEEGEEGEAILSTGAIVIFLMLMFYMSVGAYIEKNHIKFGHEASFTVCMGKFITNNNHLFAYIFDDRNAYIFH